MSKNNLFIMMVGLPGTGKSTCVENIKNSNFVFPDQEPVIVSSDKFIEQYAKNQNSTYGDVFKDYIKTSTKMMNDELEDAITNNKNIIWDQTNLNIKTRASKLAKIPDNYRKYAIYMPLIPAEELFSRINLYRPEKTIPLYILESMFNSYEKPTKQEGFDGVMVFNG